MLFSCLCKCSVKKNKESLIFSVWDKNSSFTQEQFPGPAPKGIGLPKQLWLAPGAKQLLTGQSADHMTSSPTLSSLSMISI